MKAKVKLSYSVELFVEGKDMDEIQDWLNSTTPDEAKKLVAESTGNYIEEDYSDEIICSVRDDSTVDYCISRPKSLLAIIAENGGAPYVCTSFGEAEHNSRDRNIVIIDNADIYFTCKKDGVFGELESWSEDEFKEEPDMYDVVEDYLAQYLNDRWFTQEKDDRFTPYGELGEVERE